MKQSAQAEKNQVKGFRIIAGTLLMFAVELDPDNAKMVMKSKPFLEFFTKSTKFVEKTLNMPKTVLIEEILENEADQGLDE